MQRARRIWWVALLAACAPSAQPRGGVAPLPPPYELVIGGGRIVDGTGAAWSYGDVVNRGNRIARITPAALLRDAQARERVDARGMVVAPGFNAWLRAMERHGISPNVVSFLGAATVREYVKGMALGEPTPAELDRMRAVVRDGPGCRASPPG